MAVAGDHQEGSLQEEVELLEAIYIHELTIEGLKDRPSSISLLLHPSTGDKGEKQYVCLTLEILLPDEYPSTLPGINIRNPRGLSDAHVGSIISNLRELAESRLGSPMLYELIEYAKESLTDNNIPSCACAICLSHFQDSHCFTKTECYHYFHCSCLARYIDYSLGKIKENQSTTNIISDESNQDDNQIVCPMCRLPITYDLEALKTAPEDVLSDNETSYSPDKKMKQLQKEMAALFKKQFEKGGIINVEEEKNKFLIEIKTTPVQLNTEDTTGKDDGERENDIDTGKPTSASVVVEENKSKNYPGNGNEEKRRERSTSLRKSRGRDGQHGQYRTDRRRWNEGPRNERPRNEGRWNERNEGPRNERPRNEGRWNERNEGPRNERPRNEGRWNERNEGPRNERPRNEGRWNERNEGPRNERPRNEGRWNERNEGPRNERPRNEGRWNERNEGQGNERPRNEGRWNERNEGPRNERPRNEGRWNERNEGPRSEREFSKGQRNREVSQKAQGAGKYKGGPGNESNISTKKDQTKESTATLRESNELKLTNSVQEASSIQDVPVQSHAKSDKQGKTALGLESRHSDHKSAFKMNVTRESDGQNTKGTISVYRDKRRERYKGRRDNEDFSARRNEQADQTDGGCQRNGDTSAENFSLPSSEKSSIDKGKDDKRKRRQNRPKRNEQMDKDGKPSLSNDGQNSSLTNDVEMAKPLKVELQNEFKNNSNKNKKSLQFDSKPDEQSSTKVVRPPPGFEGIEGKSRGPTGPPPGFESNDSLVGNKPPPGF